MKIRLIYLEITGFKSFQKKKKIPLNDDFIALVGLNGCGKSNIFEAFLWVLGESSKESLRIERSSDIFYESLKGESVFFAEVTLQVEILEKEDFFKKTIHFTRRFYTKGDNKYFVDYKPVSFIDYETSLRDLHLFPSSYILLAQGKSDAFLGKKSEEEILLMVEEMAGLKSLKDYKEQALKKMAQIQKDFKTKSKKWEEISLKYHNYESLLKKKSQAIKLKEKFEALEIKIVLLEMYYLYQEMEKWKEIDKSDEKNPKTLANNQVEISYIATQLTLLRERLKSTEVKLKNLQKEKLTYERNLERTLLEWDSLTRESEREKEILAIFQEKIPSKQQFLKEINSEKDYESVLLNDLMRLQSEIETSLQKTQKLINESFLYLSHKLPKDLNQKIFYLKKDLSILKEMSRQEEANLSSFVKKFMNSHEIFWKFLENFEKDFLSIYFGEHYRELLSLKRDLNEQEDKVNRLKSVRSERDQEIAKHEKEHKDWIEEETVHKNHFDMLSLREEILKEKRDSWKEFLKKNEIEKSALESERKRLTKEKEQWQEKESSLLSSVKKDSLVILQEESSKRIKIESRWLSLKRLLPQEAYWQDFLTTDSPKDFATYDLIAKEREEVKKRLLPLKIWLIEDFSEKEYEKIHTFYGENLAEKKDLEASLKSFQKIVKKIEKEYKKKINETLSLLNVHLKEISQKRLIKDYVILEPQVESLHFQLYSVIKGSLKSLKVLSRGERASVFLSFLLAVHKISHSPFIFLDEIDASLDEANTDFWSDILKEISSHQQVIIITHNPKISQKAGLILGVTLSKQGDSEVYSLDLNKEGKFI